MAIALVGVLLALLGNVVLNPDYVRIFGLYFAVAVAIVAMMFFRSKLLTLSLKAAKRLCELPPLKRLQTGHRIAALLQEVQCRSVVFLATEGTRREIRHAAEYVRRNEQMRILKVVWCYDNKSEIPKELSEIRLELDQEFRDLHIDLLLVRGQLEPSLLQALSQRPGVPLNYMFITASAASSIEDLAKWGGVRIVA